MKIYILVYRAISVTSPHNKQNMNIDQIIARINANTTLLASGQISEIDRDILLADLRELYTLAKDTTTTTVVKKVETQEVAKEVVKEIPEVPVVKAETHIQPPRTLSEPILIPVLEEVEIVVPTVHKTEVLEAPVEIVTKRIHYHEGSPVRGPKTGSLNEVFVGEEKSINTLLSGSDKKKALNDALSGKDLKSLIDLNKQHVLTRELFDGDAAAFQTAISHINSCATIEAAFEYIKTTLMPKYQWNSELQSTRLFDKLVRQKFGV